MKDREFLIWLADRLVIVYKESEHLDFVHKLSSIILAMDPEKETPNTRSYAELEYLEETKSTKPPIRKRYSMPGWKAWGPVLALMLAVLFIALVAGGIF